MTRIMHRIRIAAALALALLAAPAAAHGQQDSIQLSAFRTPPSPAFTLLGVSPTSVARPTTPRAFALSLLSAGEGAGVLPENYAAEFAPYWMARRPSLTFDEYFDPNVWQSIQQTFSLSVATAEETTTADSATGVGLGFRFAPLSGSRPARVDSLVAELRTAQRRAAQFIALRNAARRRGDDSTVAVMEDSIAGVGSTRVSLATEIAKQERVGLTLEVAGGITGSYPERDFSEGRMGKAGLWSTLGYRLEAPRIDGIVLGRWLRDEAQTDGQDLWDVGGRAVLTLDRFAASAEFVRRSAGDASATGDAAYDDSNRVVGLVEYRASDDLYVTFSFGQDHSPAGSDDNPLVATLGGSFHWGSTPSVSLPAQ